MPFENDRQAVVCDLFGCHREVPVTDEADLVQAVEANGWTVRNGLFRCPEHPFRGL